MLSLTRIILLSRRNGRNSRNGFAQCRVKISVLSVGQKYSFVEKPAAWYNKSPTVIGFAASLVEEMTEMTERLRSAE